MTFDAALPVADAIFHEGYVLYPYRASAAKNQYRWQFGVLAPRRFSEETALEAWQMQTECLLEPFAAKDVQVRLRFLQIETRRVERRTNKGGYETVDRLTLGSRAHFGWEEGVERDYFVNLDLERLLAGEVSVAFEPPVIRDEEAIPGEDGAPAGRYVRETMPLRAVVYASAMLLDAPSPLFKLTLRVENATAWAGGSNREEALGASLIATHLLLAAPGGEFLSMMDPPEWAKHHAEDCSNLRCWPVIAGEEGRRDLVLASPIILYDHPQVAPESAGEFFDATEIDELLALRTMTLTPEEKEEARLTDPRAAALIDQFDVLPPDVMDRLHGAIRYLRDVAPAAEREDGAALPAGEGGGETVIVEGVELGRGDHVRVKPGLKATDAQDLFLEGRRGAIEKVMRDAEDRLYVAVTLTDDPGAELHRWHGRYLYFDPAELEPVGRAP